MSQPPDTRKPLGVPASRLGRFARLGSMTAGIAGTMALQAVGEMARGTRPEMRRLLITPGNMRRVAEELARMRGAAMKIGQLMSMDAGEVLPPELAEIMARLRDQAHFMPPHQLKRVLDRNWGADWRRSFQSFNVRPIAAASIGQVHRACLKDGRDVAVKVQYPGIARSIDSDVSNVAGLLKMSGLIPKGFDLTPYLDEARRQLHEETDYIREGAHLREFETLLEGDTRFALPRYHEDWSTGDVLTMSFLAGEPIETAGPMAGEGERNRIAAALIELTLREVFRFGVTQSDPNFANYRYDPQSGTIILLDFGASRRLDPGLTEAYCALIRAGLSGDEAGLAEAARALHLTTGGPFDAQILRMICTVFDAIRSETLFDFNDRQLPDRMRAQGMALADAGYVPPTLPMDVLYLQRKIGGMFLLGARLKARLPIREILEPFVAAT
ncbi:ABC1 kinase family protein [Primorskyibacter sp. 2E107]|uniref:ABC1 kinase family protein n=1 Tax=Primorskyibacter sp. 2E107 TaxID=3403458 RepID=UPI003AF442B4